MIKRDGVGNPAILTDMLEANEAYVRRRRAGSPSKRPRLRTVLLTCMDARIDPLLSLGLDVGEVHVLRNAGGRVTPDVVRSIMISQWLLGTRDVLVIHHTDCGLIGTAASIRGRIEAAAKIKIGRIGIRPIAALESSVREDIAVLRRSPVLRRDARLAGLVYDVRSGRLRRVPSQHIDRR